MPEKETKEQKSGPYGVKTSDTRIFFNNLRKRPVAAIIDGILSTADKHGAPTHLMTYARDINANGGIAVAKNLAGLTGKLVDKITGSGDRAHDWSAKTEQVLSNSPMKIYPIPIRNQNFSDEELEMIRGMTNNGRHGILPGNIKVYTDDNKYGGDRDIMGAVLHPSPVDVIEYGLGQTSGGNGYVYDIFDFNALSDQAKKDNAYYKEKAQQNRESREGGFLKNALRYADIRAIGPYVFSTDASNPNAKVQTLLDFNE